ncbi:putative RNA recognition motif domain, nucleotide-binding alpha-beta plait domain superfamily [Helianthus annuus]|nr:putative RNA recognition motif domain, nucleotide-binding alpha-beta plait domain superfamily [Helianthus annuus]
MSRIMGDGLHGVTNFFVTNLPERSSSKETGEVFCVFGEVVGVYVARKRDKRGNRFGFISFIGVKDKRELEVRMKDVKMGESKLLVNVARFAAENKEENRPMEPLRNQSQEFFTGSGGGKQFHLNKPFLQNHLGTSYRDSLVGSSRGNKQEEKVVEVSSYVKPIGDWFDKSLIFRTIDLTTLVKLDKLIWEAEGPKVTFKYVGGIYILLVIENKEEMLFFKDFNSNIKVWFTWVEVWKGQALPFERITWLKITGVPLHLVDNEVFDSIGRMFGMVVHASMLSKDDNDFTFDLVGVLVGDGDRICNSISLKWNDR